VRILALETTEAIGSVAAAIDDKLLLQLQLEPSQRSAQSLAPGLRNVLNQVGWRPADVELVAVTIGPGSFTGLRVGVGTAKTFAYAVGAEVLGVDTLEAIAAAAPPDVQSLAVAVDAQRGDIVGCLFRRGADGWLETAGPTELVNAEIWLSGLPAGTPLAGPVLRKLRDRLPAGLAALDPQYWGPMAGNVARLAARLHAAGRRDDIWGMVPRYSRPSAAEEKWRQQGKA
jgi:tRNA threonylcarbamoyladenosine biosynthesis protein TsaB